jgi:hypothetical protein
MAAQLWLAIAMQATYERGFKDIRIMVWYGVNEP